MFTDAKIYSLSAKNQQTGNIFNNFTQNLLITLCQNDQS